MNEWSAPAADDAAPPTASAWGALPPDESLVPDEPLPAPGSAAPEADTAASPASDATSLAADAADPAADVRSPSAEEPELDTSLDQESGDAVDPEPETLDAADSAAPIATPDTQHVAPADGTAEGESRPVEPSAFDAPESEPEAPSEPADEPRAFDTFLETVLPLGRPRSRRRSLGGAEAVPSDEQAPSAIPSDEASPDALQPKARDIAPAISLDHPAPPDALATPDEEPAAVSHESARPSALAGPSDLDGTTQTGGLDDVDGPFAETPDAPLASGPQATSAPLGLPTPDWSETDTAAMARRRPVAGRRPPGRRPRRVHRPGRPGPAPPRESAPATPSPLDEIYATDRDRPFEDPESLLGLDLGAASASATALGMGFDAADPTSHARRASDREPAPPLVAAPASVSPGAPTDDRWFSLGSLLLLAVSLAAIAAAASWPQFAGTPSTPRPSAGGGAFGDTLGDAAQATVRERQARVAAGDTAATADAPRPVSGTDDPADAPASTPAPEDESYRAVEIAPDAVSAPTPARRAPDAGRRAAGRHRHPAAARRRPAHHSDEQPRLPRRHRPRRRLHLGGALHARPGRGAPRSPTATGSPATAPASSPRPLPDARRTGSAWGSSARAQTPERCVRAFPPQAPADTWLLDLSSGGLSF